MDRFAKAELLRRLHEAPPILVLPNAWDVESAKRLAALPGCRALATTSGGVSRAVGFEDGEAPADETLQLAARIAAAVELPVTADLERGYGDPVGTARAAWEAGLAGINFEDSGGGRLIPLEEQLEAMRAIHAAVPELVLNARVDVFLSRDGGVQEAVDRANAYLDAGADCAYPIFCPPETVEDLVNAINGPINVLLSPGMPSADELERSGVARATWGSGLASLAYAEAARVAADALGA